MPLSPSMKVMALRHDAVFMKAGAYVIKPKSSPSTLICRRSSALIVPSLIGISYVFPVRLSVMESVSAMAAKCSAGSGLRYTEATLALGELAAAVCRPRLQHGGGDGLRPLEGVAEAAVPGDVRHAAESPADPEEDRVEIPFGDAVVPLDHARLRVDVRPGILGVAVLLQHARRHLEDHRDQLEQGIVLEARGLEAELALGHVARIGLAEN